MERTGNSTSSMGVPHNAASAHGQYPRFHIPGLFPLCGSTANQDSGEQVCSELTSQSLEPKGPLGPRRQPGGTGLERPVLLASLGPVWHPLSPQDIKRGHSQPQKPISSWEVGTREPQEKVSRFPAPCLPQSPNTHLTDFTQWLPRPMGLLEAH